MEITRIHGTMVLERGYISVALLNGCMHHAAQGESDGERSLQTG